MDDLEAEVLYHPSYLDDLEAEVLYLPSYLDDLVAEVLYLPSYWDDVEMEALEEDLYLRLPQVVILLVQILTYIISEYEYQICLKLLLTLTS